MNDVATNGELDIDYIAGKTCDLLVFVTMTKWPWTSGVLPLARPFGRRAGYRDDSRLAVTRWHQPVRASSAVAAGTSGSAINTGMG